MIRDIRGLEDLPLRLIVTIIVGGAAVGVITSFLFTTCWHKEGLEVFWTPEMIVLNEEQEYYPIKIYVTDNRGNVVKNANVVITGLGEAVSGKTDDKGEIAFEISIELPEFRNEGYLDIEVNAAGCYTQFYQEDAIKVVRG